MPTLPTHEHHATLGRHRRITALRLTYLAVGVVVFLASATLVWIRPRSQFPATRPDRFVVMFSDYRHPPPSVDGPVQDIQSITVSSEHCYVSDTERQLLGSCPVPTAAELDALYHVLRDNQFDTIFSWWFPRHQCADDRTTSITVTINKMKYSKHQPTECPGDPRWDVVVGTLQVLIQTKRVDQ